MSGPVVFLSDLGLRDEFVGVCHPAVARSARDWVSVVPFEAFVAAGMGVAQGEPVCIAAAS